jgi:hypothetical protein
MTHKIPDIYSQNLPTFKKALYVLAMGKEFLPVRRIVDAIKILEDKPDDKEYDSKLNRNVYTSLSKHAKNGSLIQRLRLGGEYMYGLREWHENARDPTQKGIVL